MSATCVKSYKEPPILEKEILRYAGIREADFEMLNLIKSCINEARGVISYKVCYCETSVSIRKPLCAFDYFSIESMSLAKNLEGCNSAVIFAATLGIGFDRLIAKYSRISPSRALIFQAIGAERVEALCDAFCNDIEASGKSVRHRFSVGYGDAPLEAQKDIFRVLEPTRNIGLTLGDSLLMSPTKSVTAFIGIEK